MVREFLTEWNEIGRAQQLIELSEIFLGALASTNEICTIQGEGDSVEDPEDIEKVNATTSLLIAMVTEFYHSPLT